MSSLPSETVVAAVAGASTMTLLLWISEKVSLLYFPYLLLLKRRDSTSSFWRNDIIYKIFWFLVPATTPASQSSELLLMALVSFVFPCLTVDFDDLCECFPISGKAAFSACCTSTVIYRAKEVSQLHWERYI